MDWGLYAFGIWTGFMLACAYYDLRWWANQQRDEEKTMKGNLQDPGSSKTLRWLIDHKDYPHKDYCLIWPFGLLNNGYGSTHCDGKFARAHRVMCELRHGPAPSEAHVAAHSCNRGHDGCVNPWHLDWKTQEENEADKPNRTGHRKLTIEIAREIRAAKGLERPIETARKFGTTFSNVIAIQSGRTWKEDKRYISDDVVRAIRAASGTIDAIAEQFDAPKSAVQRIRSGKGYRHVPDIVDDQPVFAAAPDERPTREIIGACLNCPTPFWCKDNAACAFSAQSDLEAT